MRPRCLPSRTPSRPVLLLALLLPAILTACAAQTLIAGTSPKVNAGCLEFPRMTYDRLNDTLPTIAQIKAYDAARDAICGKGN